MLVKLICLTVMLFLIIFGIYKACDMDDKLDDFDEYPAMCIIGGGAALVGFIIAVVNMFCGCGGNGLKSGFITFIAGSIVFIEPFVRYLFSKKRN